jgi:hypothetical protein
MRCGGSGIGMTVPDMSRSNKVAFDHEPIAGDMSSIVALSPHPDTHHHFTRFGPTIGRCWLLTRTLDASLIVGDRA